MRDLISRQAAIDALDKHIDTFDAIDTNYLRGLRTAMSFLKEMPSAEPEWKKGKWLVDEDGNMECPFCGNTCGFGNFCNECGADLRGE